MRKSIDDLLEEAGMNLMTEYTRLYALAHNYDILCGDNIWDCSLIKIAEANFIYFDYTFKGRAVFFKEIEKLYGDKFVAHPKNVDSERLIDYCEFLYNISVQVEKLNFDNGVEVDHELIGIIKKHIDSCANAFGYTRLEKDGLFIFVEASKAALSVAEVSDNALAEKTLEYNHHRLKGNPGAKLSILKQMADDIEPQRKALNGINRTLADQLFQMLQKFVRHSHENTPYIDTITDEELEGIYDDIYQMWLLAKLELDNVERKQRIKELLDKING